MAQSSSYTPIQVYRSETPDAEPSAGNLAVGELAVNIADGKIFTKNTAGEIVELTGASSHVHTVDQITNLTTEIETTVETEVTNQFATIERPEVITLATSSDLLAAWEGDVVSCTAQLTITVQPNSTIALPTGYIAHFHHTSGTDGDVVTIAAGGGVTINTAEGLTTRKSGSAITLIKLDTDTWALIGDLVLA